MTIQKDLNGKLHFKEDALPDYQRDREIPDTVKAEFDKMQFECAEIYIKNLITLGQAPNPRNFRLIVEPLNNRQLIKLHNKASEIFADIYAQIQPKLDRTQDLQSLEKRKELAKRFVKPPGVACGLWVVAFRTVKAVKKGSIGAAIIAATAAAYTYLPYFWVSFQNLGLKNNLRGSRLSRDLIQEKISLLQQDRKGPT